MKFLGTLIQDLFKSRRRNPFYKRCCLSVIAVKLLVIFFVLLVVDYNTDTSVPRQLLNKLYLGKWYELRTLSDLGKGTVTSCGGKFTTYASNFAFAQDIVINKCFGYGELGESCEGLTTDDSSSLKPGYFSIRCGTDSPLKRVTFEHGLGQSTNHLNQWLSVLKVTNQLPPTVIHQPGFTIAIMRYEYVNLYHSLTDVYNAFLLLTFLKKDPRNTHVLLIDDHPDGSLYPMWGKLFSTVAKINQISTYTAYGEMAWNTVGYNSPLYFFNTYLPHIPLLEEFRQFFLSGHQIKHNEHKPKCGALNILFIWRHDYVAHPNNPTGMINRKIANEDELVNAVKVANPKYQVKGVQLDANTMEDQLRDVASADIMIGMHGAGLTHALFLPKTSGLIELFPNYWHAGNPKSHLGNTHFMGIANWRGLHYEQWENKISNLELKNFKTKVPPEIIISNVDKISRKICNSIGQ